MLQPTAAGCLVLALELAFGPRLPRESIVENGTWRWSRRRSRRHPLGAGAHGHVYRPHFDLEGHWPVRLPRFEFEFGGHSRRANAAERDRCYHLDREAVLVLQALEQPKVGR